jgi:hypothetical protein
MPDNWIILNRVLDFPSLPSPMSATPYIGCGVGRHSEKHRRKKKLGKKNAGKIEVEKKKLFGRFLYLRVNASNSVYSILKMHSVNYSSNYATPYEHTLKTQGFSLSLYNVSSVCIFNMWDILLSAPSATFGKTTHDIHFQIV